MKVLVWLGGAFFVLVVVVVAGMLWLQQRAQAATHAQQAELTAALQPVADAFGRGEQPDDATIARLAADPWTRGALRELLVEKHREALFPAAYFTRVALAESALVVWLAHPNELAARPDQIELEKEVSATYEGAPAKFVVFRFRTNAPHWASNIGWMAGIAGPYRDPAEVVVPSDGGVFSTFEPWASRTPEAHVEAALAEIRGPGVTRPKAK